MQLRDKFSPFHPQPPQPLRASAYPEDLNTLAAGLSDDEALRKIGRRTTPFGRVVTILMVGGAVVLGYLYYQSSKRYDARMDILKEAGNLEGEAMYAKVREALAASTYDDVKVRAIRNLGHFKDAQAVPLLIQELGKPGVVRAQAASALAAIGSPAADPAKPALLAALPTCDEKDRPQVVWALAVLKERAASDAILQEFVRGIWQKQDDFDPKIVVDALGTEKLSTPELTGHNDKPVRALVAMALSEAASPAVVPALVRMIKRPDEDTEVIRAAVAGLGRAGDPSAAPELFALMTQRADLRSSVLDALGRSTAAPQLATLLSQAKDTPTKRDLARLLRRTYDPRSADALAALVEDPDTDLREEAAHALAELGDPRAVPPLVTAARGDRNDRANNALDALRQLGNPAAGPALLPLLKDFPERKAAIMRALGASHALAAGPAIEKELSGDDVSAAAKALAQLPYDKAYGKIVGMVKRDKKIDYSRPSVVSEASYRTRYESIQAIGYYGKPDPKAIKELVTVIEDTQDDARLAMVAGAALGQVADPTIQEQMLAKVSDGKLEERVRAAYVNGLWRKPNASLAPKLLPLLSSSTTPGGVKLAAALAIGYSGNPACDEGLVKLLDDVNARRYAAIAAVLGGGESTTRKLFEVLPQDRDAEEILRGAVNSNENDNFNLLLEPMFTSGQIYRRMQVSQQLKDGDEMTNTSYSYAFTQLATRLVAGWDGPAGVSPRQIRAELYKQLTTGDAARRRLVADMLVGMNMRGMLLAGRDAGVKEAREALLNMDRPKSAS